MLRYLRPLRSLHSVRRLPPPWDDLRRESIPPETKAWVGREFTRRRKRLLAVMPDVQAGVERANATLEDPVQPEWVAAVLWDELARGSNTPVERFKDQVQRIFGDPTVGPFQIRISTARDIIRTFPALATEIPPMTNLADLLRKDLRAGAMVVAFRFAQIDLHWAEAGYPPKAAGGIGPEKISFLQLVGTLYSQGLGVPKPDPRPNERGMQISEWAEQISTGIPSPPDSSL
ncbi:MAG: hypothetical protein AAF514_08120 [Verrucomicrobiota bacterium]